MEFIPAGEIIGTAHHIRRVGIRQSQWVPDGEYKFVDMYCVDPECDCCKAMINVYHNNKWVSTINYGWESPGFYKNWMGDLMDDKVGSSMSGASIDINSPNLVSPQGMISFFNVLLSEEWIAKFKEHYAAVKKNVAKKNK